MAATSKHLLDDYHLLSYDVLDSTNEEAKRLAEGGACHGAVIWAKKQTAGKGRMGREWVSSEGNLYLSVLLSPDCSAECCAELSFVTAVASVETLKPIVANDANIECKWPNDILLDGRKVGGVLLEYFVTDNEDGEEQQWVVVGVGINVDHYPEEVMYPATCLRESGVEIISAKIVLSRFVYNFVHTYDLWSAKGFAPIRKAWLEHACKLGEPIEVRLPDANYEGIFEGIDEKGALQLKENSGNIRSVSAGDVFF